MSNEIVITIKGNVGGTPVLNRPEGKEPWTHVNVASARRIRHQDGTWVDGETQWFTVKFFGDFARNVAESIHKGDTVVVQGRLERKEWTTKDGERRWDSVITPYAFGPDLQRAIARVTRTARSADAGTSVDDADSDLVDTSGMQELPDDDPDAFDGPPAEDDTIAARIGVPA